MNHSGRAAEYGSEALAGVVNIITEKPSQSGGQLFSRYGTNATSNLSFQGSRLSKNFSSTLYLDRFQTAGYDLSPDKFGKTVSPFTNYTMHSRSQWRTGKNTTVNLSARGFHENQQFGFEVASGNLTTRTYGQGVTRDWNVNPVINHRFSPNLETSVRLYYTEYETETALNLESSGLPYYQDDFKQGFFRWNGIQICQNTTLQMIDGNIRR